VRCKEFTSTVAVRQLLLGGLAVLISLQIRGENNHPHQSHLYSFQSTSTLSTTAIPHCPNFATNFLITICNAGSSQHSCKKSNPGFCPEFAATLSFCIRDCRIFDRVTVASCDHFFSTGDRRGSEIILIIMTVSPNESIALSI
jgi:hypothetical protein